MDKLPQELLGEVLQYLPRTDLPTIRLLNRTLAAEAEPALFHTIPLWIELKSLEALTSVSEHPRLSQYVKEIVFSPLRFLEHEDRSSYEAGVRDALEYQSASLSSHILRLGNHMAAYDSFSAGQQYLAANSVDVKVLSHAFGKLRQFKTLVVDYSSKIAAIRLYEAFGGYESKPDLVACDGAYGLPVLFKALVYSKVAISTFRIGRSRALDSTWSDPDTKRDRFKSLRSSPVLVAKRTISLALRKTFDPPNDNGFKETLRDLRVFEVSEIELEDPNRLDFNYLITGMCTILSWGSHIESIAVPQFGGYAFDDAQIPWMIDLFRTARFKKLQKLKLESFKTTLQYFILFFRDHGKQLKEIEFHDVYISDAELSTAMNHLRAMEFPELVTFEVDCVNVYDYITGVTDSNPMIE